MGDGFVGHPHKELGHPQGDRARLVAVSQHALALGRGKRHQARGGLRQPPPAYDRSLSGRIDVGSVTIKEVDAPVDASDRDEVRTRPLLVRQLKWQVSGTERVGAHTWRGVDM